MLHCTKGKMFCQEGSVLEVEVFWVMCELKMRLIWIEDSNIQHSCSINPHLLLVQTLLLLAKSKIKPQDRKKRGRYCLGKHEAHSGHRWGAEIINKIFKYLGCCYVDLCFPQIQMLSNHHTKHQQVVTNASLLGVGGPKILKECIPPVSSRLNGRLLHQPSFKQSHPGGSFSMKNLGSKQASLTGTAGKSDVSTAGLLKPQKSAESVDSLQR